MFFHIFAESGLCNYAGLLIIDIGTMERLNEFIDKLYEKHQDLSEFMPDAGEAHLFADKLIRLLFPNNPCDKKEEYRLRFRELGLTLEGLIVSLGKNSGVIPRDQAQKFFITVPEVYELLVDDAEAIYRCDPAATNLQEVICAYPGFYAIAVYRFAHLLYRQGVPVLPRIMAEYAHARTGIDLHPGASIGKSFFIDHGTGVVIGETSIIGNNVKIYQGVTLGAMIVKKSMASTKRHPTIQDNVIIYAGSTVLGGETVIGHDSVIGGNVWLTESVPPHSVVYHTSTVKIRNSKNNDYYTDFSI